MADKTAACVASAISQAKTSTPRPGDHPSGRLLCRFQERVEIFGFGDQLVLDGDHAGGALTLALEVRPVATRSVFGLSKLGFKLGDRFECGDHVGDRPRGDRAGRGLCLISPRSCHHRCASAAGDGA
jgi:hypothetical protein